MDWSLLGFSGIRQVYNIHPALVHFPIALFPSALLLYLLGFLLTRQALHVAGRSCLYLASVGTLITVLTGRMAEASFPHNEAIHHLMRTHETIGYTILAVAFVLAAWSFWHVNQKPKRGVLFLALLTLNTFLVLQNGDLGGRMVFVEGAAVKAAVRVTQSEPLPTGEEGETEPAHHHADDDDHQHEH